MMEKVNKVRDILRTHPDLNLENPGKNAAFILNKLEEKLHAF